MTADPPAGRPGDPMPNPISLLRRRVGPLPNPVSAETRAIAPRIAQPGVRTTVSVCPYCAVGCSQLVYTRGHEVIDIEGNPDSPINAGTLCPKGAATRGLIASPLRVTEVKYRPPFGTAWETRPLAWAMDRIARLVKQTRDETWIERDGDGKPANRTLAIGHLGGATLDNEENYLIKKLFTAGLGIVAVENQARI
jgi:formate dehydrogenase major subunit